jgi:ABC-type Fe3+-hydroxamate transport system substrate-binding protein
MTTLTAKIASVLLLLPASLLFLNQGADAADFKLNGPNRIIDQGGRAIEVSKPFRRIISLYGAHTENLFALGLDQEIIGVSRSDEYPPQALQRTIYSYHDDPEKFLVAGADLVLIRPMIDRGYPQFVERLQSAGITVVSLQPATVQDLVVYWKILGALCGRPNRAEAMAGGFQRAVAAFHDLTAPLPSRKRVYFEAIHDKMKTFSPDSMAIFALETAGGVNIASDASPVRGTNIAAYGKERILAQADNIDVYLAQSGTMNRPSPELIKNEPGFHAIKAVRDNQVYIIDEEIVSRPTMRLLDGVLAIGKILYPKLFDEKAQKIVERAME